MRTLVRRFNCSTPTWLKLVPYSSVVFASAAQAGLLVARRHARSVRRPAAAEGIGQTLGFSMLGLVGTPIRPFLDYLPHSPRWPIAAPPTAPRTPSSPVYGRFRASEDATRTPSARSPRVGLPVPNRARTTLDALDGVWISLGCERRVQGSGEGSNAWYFLGPNSALGLRWCGACCVRRRRGAGWPNGLVRLPAGGAAGFLRCCVPRLRVRCGTRRFAQRNRLELVCCIPFRGVVSDQFLLGLSGHQICCDLAAGCITDIYYNLQTA